MVYHDYYRFTENITFQMFEMRSKTNFALLMRQSLRSTLIFLREYSKKLKAES